MPRLTERTKELLDRTMRTSICEEALELVKFKGTDGWTMNDLAENLKIAKGTLYNYFKNKGDLIVSAMNQHFDGMRIQIEELLQSAISPDIKMLGVAKILAENFLIHFRLHEFHVLDGFKKRENHRLKLIKKVSELVESGIAIGLFRYVDSIAFSEIFLGAIREFNFSDKIGQPNRSINDQQRLLAELLIDNIKIKNGNEQ